MNLSKKLTGIVAIGLAVALPLSASASIRGTSAKKSTTTTTSIPSSTNTYSLPTPFDPYTAAGGSNDLYHCSLIDPNFTEGQYITANQFIPGAPAEVHHAILFLVNANQASTARSLDNGGAGWTCFGAPLNPSGSFDGTPWLGAAVPGNAASSFPAGTGVYAPAGSLIVMQIHYNLLAGHASDLSQVRLTTVSSSVAAGRLKALSIDPLVAPVDLPCPKGVTGALCSRTASLNDLAARFGNAARSFVNGIEFLCGHTPPADITTKATKKITTGCTTALPSGVLRQVTPHMHFLGRSWQASITSGGVTKKIATVANYNFDAQITYTLKTPLVVKPGDRISFSCTHDPTLRQRLAATKDLAPRYVTWGDGSSDEMCMAILGMTTN